MPPLREPTADDTRSLIERQVAAFKCDAIEGALGEVESQSVWPQSIWPFINAMNRVIRQYGGKMPDPVHAAYDRLVSKHDRADLQTIVDWLKSEMEKHSGGPQAAKEPSTVEEILNGQSLPSSTPEQEQLVDEQQRTTDETSDSQ